MIKKFEEYISEGFWKDSIKRAKDNIPRTEDIPKPIKSKNWHHIVYPLDGYDGYFIGITWLKKKNFEPRVYVYYEKEEFGAIYGYKDIQNNGVDKRFNIDGANVFAIEFNIDYKTNVMPDAFNDAVNKLLKRLPDSAFERTGIKYDIEKKGYPVEGYKDWYIDFEYNNWDDNCLYIYHYTKVCRYVEYPYSKHSRCGGIRKQGFSGGGGFKVEGNRIEEDGIFTYEQLDFEDGRKPMTDKEIKIITSQPFVDAVDETLKNITIDDYYNEEPKG